MAHSIETIAAMISSVPRNRVGKVIFSRAQRQEILAVYEQSQLSMKEFSDRVGLGATNLSYWLSSGYKGAKRPSTKLKTKAFNRIEVVPDVPPPREGPRGFTIRGPGGITVEGLSVDALAKLFTELKE